MNDNNGENIVISGISGRFPKSQNVEELSKNLYAKIDMISDVKTGDDFNAKVPKRRGIIDNLNKFDASCFHVSTRQAEAMSPENRILLEVAVEAIFDAGINPESLRGSNTAVCLAQSTYDSMYTNVYGDASSDIHSFLGTSSPIAANRVSFSLGLRGVSIAIDVSCASSFVAFELATNWIRQGVCDAVLVLTANVQSHSVIPKMFARLNMLNPDGCSRPFDNNANGYVRSDTISGILVQKQKHAKRIYAKVEQVACNHDGFKVKGITHPSGESQSELCDMLYKRAGISPLDVHFVEAHGTGTKVGDPEECHAIDTVFCKNRTEPLLIGSTKSNMGHAEGASGIISIMKAIFTFQTGLIPPNINFSIVRQDIPALASGRLKVCTEPTPLKGSLIAVNVFGIGGVNVHALLRKADKRDRPNRDESLPILICWSGRTEEAVRTVFERLKSIPIDVEFIALLHNIQKTEFKAHLHRGHILLKGDEGDTLPQCIDEKTSAVEEQNNRPIVWMFSGLGSQYPKVAQHLMQIQPFANSISKCHEVLAQFDMDLIASLTQDESAFDNLVNSFVCVTAIQIALVDVLKLLNVPVDFYIGHSMGEIGCAYSDGGLTLEQTIIMSYYRGKCSVDGKTTDGAMAAIGLGYDEVKNSLPPSIQVACRNSSNSCTVSGPKTDILEYIDKMRSTEIFAKEVNCGNIAFHSKYITEAGAKLLEKLKTAIPTKVERSPKWLSTSNEQHQWHTDLAKFSSADYFVNNFLNPVLFEETCKLLPERAIVIEIAPHRLMQSIVKKSLPNAIYVPLTFRQHNNQVEFLTMALGRLYMSGVTLQIDRLYPAVTFPVSQGTPMISPLIKWNHERDWPTIQNKTVEMVHHVQNTIYVRSSDGKYKFIDGHRIDGRCILPVAFILNFVKDTAIGADAKAFGLNAPIESLVFENVKFLSTTELKPNNDIKLSVSLQPTNGKFEVYEGTTAIASGFIKCTSTPSSIRDVAAEVLHKDLPILTSSDVYKEFRLRGYNYADEFKTICLSGMDGCYGQLKCKNNNWTTLMDGMIQLVLLSKDTRSLLTPVEIHRIQINVNNHFNRLNGTHTHGEQLFATYYSNEHSTIVCGSIEMSDVKFDPVERDGPDGIEVLQTYQFVPLIDADLPNFIDAVGVCIELALEKNQEERVLLLEIHSGDGNPAIECIYEIFQKMPLIVADLTLLIGDDDIVPLNCESIKRKGYNSSLEDEHYTFIVMKECMQNNRFLEMAKRSLSKEGFFISIDEIHVNITVPHDFTVISRISCDEWIITLLQRIPSESDDYKIIHIDSEDRNFKWLRKVQEANASDHVLLVAQHDETSGVLGLIKCLRLELDTKRLRCIIIEDVHASPFDVNVSLYKNQLLLQLPINIYRDAKWGTYRHLDLKPATVQCESKKRMIVNVEQINGQRTYHWMPQAELDPANDIVKVQYATLNFCDRLVARGSLPNNVAIKNRLDEYRPLLGFECAGVTDNQKRVMCFSLSGGLLSTHICRANADIVLEVPDTMSLRDAATIPHAYFTVYYAFFVKNSIKSDQSILINTDCGGVGLSAIRVSLAYGLNVFTVVPTRQTRGFLLDNFPQLKEQNVAISSDYSVKDLVMNITNNEGTDFVLNALSDNKHQQASIRCLKRGGTFMELGKFDAHKSSEFVMDALRNGINIQSIVIEHAIQRSLERNTVIELMRDDIKRRIIHPLPLTVFEADDLENAFKYLTNAETVGKILIEIRRTENSECTLPVTVWPRALFEPELIYVLIGGLGGFGLEFADWMIMRGARKLSCSTRRGVSDQYQRSRIKKWESYGCTIVINTSNVTTFSGCAELLSTATEHGQIGGIFNLAVVLRDGILANQTTAKYTESFAPKVWATAHLDTLSRTMCPRLSYFVVFSSFSSGYGNPGQSNYGMANSIMEKIIERRTRCNLPGKAIQWAAIGDVGILMSLCDDNIRVDLRGTVPKRMDTCLNALDELLTHSEPTVACTQVQLKKQQTTNKFNVTESICQILGIDQKLISMNARLSHLGMDSLMAVEVRQMLRREINLVLSYDQIKKVTIGQLNNDPKSNQSNTVLEA
ncbi:fatty acid synthase-like [Bradysia coprophila]|uniref:fatty acid synthase-like n=1 Tax=Bradysia coprophila TaxID=38358 RepID=UPI00187DD31C|nr:fatty acid synthase-like [Bradysia coprophila]